jgi:hypothetical protein
MILGGAAIAAGLMFSTGHGLLYQDRHPHISEPSLVTRPATNPHFDHIEREMHQVPSYGNSAVAAGTSLAANVEEYQIVPLSRGSLS